jgi:hypothetical protein
MGTILGEYWANMGHIINGRILGYMSEHGAHNGQILGEYGAHNGRILGHIWANMDPILGEYGGAHIGQIWGP